MLQLLQKFSNEESFELRIIPTTKLRKNEFKTEQNYWKNFYKRFIAYLFSTGAHDNYAGSVFKNIKVFFNYIEQEKNISINGLHKKFFVVQSEPPIYTLDAQQLQQLIYDKEFEQRLDYLQKLTKDIFVFGATVALRISDLMNLKQHNIIEFNGNVYLRTNSIKTNTFSQVKLPEYASKSFTNTTIKEATFFFRTFTSTRSTIT